MIYIFINYIKRKIYKIFIKKLFVMITVNAIIQQILDLSNKILKIIMKINLFLVYELFIFYL